MVALAKHLPADIITDILSRLPLKSLVRFRYVSKDWLHFITHSRFPYWLLYRHLHCDPLTYCSHNQSNLLLYYNKPTKSERSDCKLYSLGGGFHEDSFRVVVEVDFPLIRGKSFEIKTGCCHGMICLAIKDHSFNTLVLWNPSIGDYRTIPLPEEFGICEGIIGLGFDSSMDDYKIVSLCEKQIYVFAVKRNSWKNLGELAYSVFNGGIPANGCLYWAASKTHKFADKILCLNLSNETFKEISPPLYDPSISRHTLFQDEEDQFIIVAELNLLLWGNSLALFRQYDQSLWVMKEVKEENGGVEEIWMKIMTIPKISNQESHFRFYYRLHPKCFTKNGKLIVSVKHKWFVLYDGAKYEDLHVQELPDGKYNKAIVYTESLISPGSIRGMNDID